MWILALIAAYPDDVLCARKSMREAKKANLGPCGQKYLRMINNKCYYVGVKKVSTIIIFLCFILKHLLAGLQMSWFGAQNNCLRKNLNLADMAPKEDFEAIIKFLKSRGSLNDYWWGGNDLQTEGRFTYISTGRPVKYLGGQGKVEPTARSNEDDCLEVRLRENSTLVIDENCQEKQYFVCQRPDTKCAHPIEDAKADDRHSHEHLHHFHHNPAANEATGGGAGSQEGSAESDSRPADNSNSTEIGESPEEVENGEDEKPTEGGGSAENTKETGGEGGGEGEDGGGEGGEGGGEDAGEGGHDGRDVKSTTPGDDKKKTTKAKAKGETTTPADGAATTVTPPEGEATTAAPEGEATTVAAVEGEITTPGAEGEATTPGAEGEPATPGAEGENTAAPPEGETTPAAAPAEETPAVL